MDNAEVAAQLSRALYLSLMLSGPTILVAAIVGILFAVVQALTQIQEQTLSFAVKLLAVMAALAFTFQWMGSELYQFAFNLFDVIPSIGRAR